MDGDRVSDRAASLADWRDLVGERFVALDVRGDREFAGGRVATRTIGPLAVSRIVSGPQRVSRTGGLIDRYGEDVVQVGMARSGRPAFDQDGRSCELTSGQYVLYRSGGPFTWTMPGDWTMDVFTWPRHAVALDDGALAALTGRALGAGAAAQIARAALTQLTAVSAEPGEQEASLLASRLADLVLAAAAVAGHPERPAADVALADVLDYVELHLGDPELTPESIARAFHVSVRGLHRMFADRPRTLVSWIRYRRLERARAEMGAGSARPIAAVAARCCFADTSAFARAFRREYGCSPREYREGTA